MTDRDEVQPQQTIWKGDYLKLLLSLMRNPAARAASTIRRHSAETSTTSLWRSAFPGLLSNPGNCLKRPADKLDRYPSIFDAGGWSGGRRALPLDLSHDLPDVLDLPRPFLVKGRFGVSPPIPATSRI